MIARASIKIIPLLLSIMLLVACGPAQNTEQHPAETRNVILFIGDGFGAAQTSLGVQYARLIEKRELNIESLMHDGNTGYSLLLPFGSIVIDSAAAATQLATGQAVRNETLGLNPDGYPIETIVEWAHEHGLGTGLVTNMRITHATPAAFAVHQGSRYNSGQTRMEELLRDGDGDVRYRLWTVSFVRPGDRLPRPAARDFQAAVQRTCFGRVDSYCGAGILPALCKLEACTTILHGTFKLLFNELVLGG